MEKYFFGVDVGGMSIKGGIISSLGKIIYKEAIKTNGDNPITFKKTIEKLILNLTKKSKEEKLNITKIGFGVPGIIDKEKGTIVKMANIGCTNFSLKEICDEFNLELYLSNDANVAVLAEQKFGVAKGYSNVVMLTLGTGIGGGVIIDNKLFEGNKARGTELGHSLIKLNGEKCGCGRRGCLEAYASAKSLIRDTKKMMEKHKDSLMWSYSQNKIENVNGKTSFECAKLNDKYAKKVVSNYIKYLGEGMLDYCNIFRPEVFVIGGGLSNQGDCLKKLLEDYLIKQDYGYEGSPESKVLIAELKNDAGIIGAASLCM